MPIFAVEKTLYNMEQLQIYFDKLLRETSVSFHRYMYNVIDWDARMLGIVGPRGVGKTTLVLQHIKEQLPRKEAGARQTPHSSAMPASCAAIPRRVARPSASLPCSSRGLKPIR